MQAAYDDDTEDDYLSEDGEYVSDEDDDDDENWVDLSEESLGQLKRNDPKINYMKVWWEEDEFVNSVDWTENGCHIGNNTHLKRLDVSFFYYSPWDDAWRNYEAFCRGIANNRSIESIAFVDVSLNAGILNIVSPFIEHNSNLRHLTISSCRIGPESISLLAAALSRRVNKNSLIRIELSDNKFTGRAAAELITALDEYNNLLKLELSGNKIGREGCISLGKNFLQNPMCKLQKLDLSNSDIDEECFSILANGLVKNRKLRSLKLSSILCINNGLRAFSVCLQSPALALTKLDLGHSNIEDKGAATLGRYLGNNSSLKILNLCANKLISEMGWQAFSTCLWNPNSALEELNLCDSSIDNEGIATLGDALGNNKKLKTLFLGSNGAIGAPGWEAFSSCLRNPNSALEKLYISSNKVGSTGIAALGNALSTNTTLSILDLSRATGSSISAGWQTFATCLRSPNSALAELNLSYNNIDDDAAVALGDALTNNTKLKVLNLCHNEQIGTGWRVFFNRLLNPDSALKRLDISHNNIDNEGVAALSRSFAYMRSILSLDLIDNRSITTTGWLVLTTLLQSPISLIKEINIYNNNINDEVLIAFATALADNTKLQTLWLKADGAITLRGWDALSQLLCNKSSIDSIYSSNHTLRNICPEASAPKDIVSSLHLNKNNNKAEVARQKILQHHFLSNGFNIQAFVDMETNFLPRAISWISRDIAGLSLLYELFLSMPSLFDSVSMAKAGRKRKRH